jgi:flagellar motility protein MotE (MotC chaperone)
MKKENIQNLAKSVEDEKDPYRRGVYHPENKGISGILTNQLDRGVKEKRGRKEEIKILETKNKQRLERQVLAIRKFLRMETEKFKIIDQRRSRIMPDKLD